MTVQKLERYAALNENLRLLDIFQENYFINWKKAPELIEFKEYDARVDVYSLGVVIYEMGSGLPFLINNDKPM